MRSGGAPEGWVLSCQLGAGRQCWVSGVSRGVVNSRGGWLTACLVLAKLLPLDLTISQFSHLD